MGDKSSFSLFLLFALLALSVDLASSATCGDGTCEYRHGETETTCRADCCTSVWAIHYAQEAVCQTDGWTKAVLHVSGRPRNILMLFPDADVWQHGAMILLHGGTGSHGSQCGAKTAPFVAGTDFTGLAAAQGFAVFALDSTYDQATDYAGRGIGKRWDALDADRPNNVTIEANVDLPFIERVITNLVPAYRPEGSSEAVFITGQSTGGFMTNYAATKLGHLIHGFAGVASGDPYGEYFDIGIPATRECAPGVVVDFETGLLISRKDGCLSTTYPNERIWPATRRKLPFRLFHHSMDCVCDVSCMWKVSAQLKSHGYLESPLGPFVLDRTSDPSWVTHLEYPDAERGITCHLEDHYWQTQYSQPVLDFFKLHSSYSCSSGCGTHGKCVFSEECACHTGWTGSTCDARNVSSSSPSKTDEEGQDGNGVTVGVAVGVPLGLVSIFLSVVAVVLTVILCVLCKTRKEY